MKKNSTLDVICFILVIIGALNWGLLGVFKFNIIVAVFGAVPALVHAIYIIIGLAALIGIFQYAKCCRK